MPSSDRTARGPDWIGVLRQECQASTQARVARRIGYGASVVSQVLAGTYKGDLTAVRQAVEGALMSGRVDCPVLGDIGTDRCLRFQRQPLATTSPERVRLHRTCPTCPHSRTGKAGGTTHEDADAPA